MMSLLGLSTRLVLLLEVLGVVWSFTVVAGTARFGSMILAAVPSWVSGVAGVAPASLLDERWSDGLLERTSLGGVELECAYKASRDGWSAMNFHEKVDQRGSALVVALSRSGCVFGGFNPLGWRSTDDYYGSNSAFLWFLKDNAATRCPVLPGGE